MHTNINVRTKSSNFKKKVESFDIKYIKISEYEIESIFKKLKEASVKVSTIARGIAFGDELEYADEITLGRSIANRLPYESSINS